jgi:myo-inositol catabolism protein IolS
MEKVELGDTGQYISRLAMGGSPISGHGWGKVDEAESIAAINRAVDLGVNCFDTADVYGLGYSERLLAAALGRKRHGVVIATKFGVRWGDNRKPWRDISPAYLRKALDDSLDRLQLDCIPLYYVHWPDGKTRIADTMAELVRCREEGKIRWIGLSNFTPQEVFEAASVTPLQSLQVQFSLLDRFKGAELVPVARQLKATLVTWGSLAEGLLTGKYDAHSTFDSEDRRSRYVNFQGEVFAKNLRCVENVRCMAKTLGKTPAQLALRWLLDTPGVGCALFGAKRPSQIEENVLASDWRLSGTDYETLVA